MSAILSTACLALVGLLCLADVVYQVRRETETHGFTSSVIDLMKTATASAVGVWALARLPDAANAEDGEPSHLALNAGLAALAVGLAWRRWRRRRPGVGR